MVKIRSTIGRQQLYKNNYNPNKTEIIAELIDNKDMYDDIARFLAFMYIDINVKGESNNEGSSLC